MSEEYDRGFSAAFEFTRMAVLISYEAATRGLMWHIEECLKTATSEATTDPHELRMRLMRAWHTNPPQLHQPAPPAPETAEAVTAPGDEHDEEKA